MKAKAKAKQSYEDVRMDHPFRDATSDWLRENHDTALKALRELQADHIQAIRELAVEHANAWLVICKSYNAPKAVVKQAESRLAVARTRAAQ
jgi:hypothetical protein